MCFASSVAQFMNASLFSDKHLRPPSSPGHAHSPSGSPILPPSPSQHSNTSPVSPSGNVHPLPPLSPPPPHALVGPGPVPAPLSVLTSPQHAHNHSSSQLPLSGKGINFGPLSPGVKRPVGSSDEEKEKDREVALMFDGPLPTHYNRRVSR
jgi:hypothetical protein